MQYTQLSRRSAGGKIDWEKQYLTFIPITDAVFSWAERATSGHLEYSVNGGQTWITIADSESTPTITAGNKVMWRGDLKPTISTNTSSAGIGTFSATGNYNAYGNIMSLLFYNNYYGSQLNSNEYKCAFCNLFYNDKQILSAPKFPATILTDNCYRQTFRNCIKLTTAPKLPAITLANFCYNSMFQGCTSLTTTPELPAITLTQYCYYAMFKDCTNLTTISELSVAILVISCYREMFQNCNKLNYIKCLATNISASLCTSLWVADVASTGTFVKAADMEDWTRGASGIPEGWTVIDNNQ